MADNETDLDALVAVFRRLGVEFTEFRLADIHQEPADTRVVRIDGDGYGGFFHVFEFRPDGGFLGHGGYE